MTAYHKLFAPIFARHEQQRWSLFYLCGQLSNAARKTMEPLVLHLKGADRAIMRAVQQFIGQGKWPAQAMMHRVRDLVADWLRDPGGILIVDGSGFPKQGHDSAGVAPQYCGHVGKVANCQTGVFLAYASPKGYAFVAGRLYVPERWFGEDYRERWQQCGLPRDLTFQTEPALALQMVREVRAQSTLPVRWVTADEHFGENPAFLDGLAALDLWYLCEVPHPTRVWLRRPRVEPPGRGPSGHLRKYPRVTANAPAPRELRELAAGIPPSTWERRVIKQGSKGPLVAEFAFLRVTAVRAGLPGPRVWAVFRRSLSQPPELKVYLSNAPASCTREELVLVSGWRWPIETLFKEAKGEVGMDHYETRSWDGWHHHMAQTFMAHLFLVWLNQKLKKKPRVDHRANSTPDCPGARRRFWSVARCVDRDSLSPMAQLCGLLLTPQMQAQSPL